VLGHARTVCCIANRLPLLVQHKVNRTSFIHFFNRSWAEYKVGFNDSNGSYWIGNDLLHQLTMTGRYKLRFDLQERSNGSWYYAEYSRFIVESEASNYLMHVSGYSGNAGTAGSGNARYGFLHHDGMMFTTYDRDNDRDSSINCAAHYGGGFWHENCHRACVNCVHMQWYANGRWIYLQASRMWLTY